MIFIYFVLFVFGVIIFGVFGVAAELHYTTKKKTAGNVWISEDGLIFIIVGYSLNRDAPYPIHIKHTNRNWLDWWAIDDKRFYRHLGTKKKYPEYFL